MDGGCGCDEPMASNVTGGAFGEDAYTGAAVFGRVYATIGAVIGVIIAIILIIIGYTKLHDPRTSTTRGVVTKVVKCEPPNKQNSDYSCVVNVSYAVGANKYSLTNLAVSQPAPLQTGSMVTLHYDPTNPSNATYEISPRKLGWGLIGGGVLVGALSVGVAVASYKSKAFAAGYGAVEGISMIGRSF